VLRPKFSIVLALLASLAACGGGGGGAKERDRAPPLVKAEPATSMRFTAAVEAVGTALANEQVTLTAPVTERLVRLGFNDGEYVRSGQMIAELALGQENAQLAEANARAREAGQQLSRIEILRRKGFATKSSLDTQVAASAAARAQAAEARASIGDRIIRAPFSGYVSLRNISPGAVVSSGTEIAQISDISRIKLDFPVPETALAQMKKGLGIVAIPAAYPDQPFHGVIETVDPVIDPNTRSVTVRAILPNPDGRLKPGMLLTVRIETQPRIALSVPELSVVGEGDQRFVYVLGADSKAKRTQVKTGLRSEGRIEILEGLKPGARVVTEGVVKLSDGMKVRLAGPNAGAKAGGGGGGAPAGRAP
jgi:membrane fusion protein (multidrug efflux system)